MRNCLGSWSFSCWRRTKYYELCSLDRRWPGRTLGRSSCRPHLARKGLSTGSSPPTNQPHEICSVATRSRENPSSSSAWQTKECSLCRKTRSAHSQSRSPSPPSLSPLITTLRFDYRTISSNLYKSRFSSLQPFSLVALTPRKTCLPASRLILYEILLAKYWLYMQIIYHQDSKPQPTHIYTPRIITKHSLCLCRNIYIRSIYHSYVLLDHLYSLSNPPSPSYSHESTPLLLNLRILPPSLNL